MVDRRRTCLLLLLIISISSVKNEESTISTDLRSCVSQSMIDANLQTFDCSKLPSELHTKLALRLTFCHLNTTGIDANEICWFPQLHQECLKNLTKNSFAYLTYTNFLPHIQSLCYSIETKRWHRQTQTTIDQLYRHSNQIESETKNLLEYQEEIQTNLDRTLQVNERSVDDALSIDRFLQIAQADVDDLRGHLYVKDKAQIQLIHQVSISILNDN